MIFLDVQLNHFHRQDTFANWPPQLKQHPARMVAAGFFYTGYNDRVVCYQCGKDLFGWKSDQDPAVEHYALFKDCPLVHSLLRDRAFI